MMYSFSKGDIMGYDLKISRHSNIGEIRIGSTATRIKIDTDELNKRHQVMVRNLSSYYIWWSLKESDCVYGGSNAHLIRSGQGFVLDLDRHTPLQIWAISKIDTVPLEIMEVV